MPLPPPDAERARRGGRAIFKAKRKGVADAETNAATAASSSASSTASAGSAAGAGSSAAPASLLPAPVGSALSFFSSAHIALCDFNIAVPVVEPSDDADIDADGGAHSAPLLEYVGTLRWCAPEVFRASGTHAATGTAAAVSAVARPSAAAAAGAGAAAAASASASSSGARPSLAALRLHAGRMGDVWSWSMVLLELLTLRLPFEDVATEEQLNQMLSRGERSNFNSAVARRGNVERRGQNGPGSPSVESLIVCIDRVASDSCEQAALAPRPS
jgi:serine/threonine protein kinase